MKTLNKFTIMWAFKFKLFFYHVWNKCENKSFNKLKISKHFLLQMDFVIF